jgi:hypothetical protein
VLPPGLLAAELAAGRLRRLVPGGDPFEVEFVASYATDSFVRVNAAIAEALARLARMPPPGGRRETGTASGP